MKQFRWLYEKFSAVRPLKSPLTVRNQRKLQEDRRWTRASKRSLLPLQSIKAQKCYSLGLLIFFVGWSHSLYPAHQTFALGPFWSHCQTFRHQTFKKEKKKPARTLKWAAIHPIPFINLFWAVKVQARRFWHLRHKALCCRAAREAALLEEDEKRGRDRRSGN